ncbi:coiled-coil domain-containing protein 68-like isoform X1 [Tympanuchus pallidicinctus]|uniref:coiled-coil domain-containing protein 68-like isoform X1 n=1 Tax=Tympanuchus pallidicinctus TaxID=109042 RepID=UPI0022876ED5|nr:coiled-coil domain-containing protein 68-like isoform X1 [Tympanuchus pallidicinctus]XP_052525881.1 coiled-coil domain-containing protein 68-like isoform X1 [Tympanuchus pallidicinctus]
MDPIEQQLLDLNHQNRILRLQLEATREAGIQALKSASQRFSETYKKKQEELKKSHHEEKQRMEAARIIELRKEWRKNMAEEEEQRRRMAEVEERLRRMEEEKRMLSTKKLKLELQLLQPPLRASARLREEIGTLEEQLAHLQAVMERQHGALRGVIGQAEELRREARMKERRVEEMEERLRGLEEENKELKARLTAQLGQSAARLSKGVGTESFRPIGSLEAVQSCRIRKLYQSGGRMES